MSSLRQVLTHPVAGQAAANSHDPGDRRKNHDRRASERRGNVFPFESRENRMRFAAQAAGFGVYDLDCTTGNSVWSPELRVMAGLPPGLMPLSTEQAESLIHPDDRERFMAKLEASLDPDGSGEFEDEYRLLRPDGTVCWARTKGRTFFVGSGESRQPLAATGIVMDLSASRAAAQQLAESREELDRMVETAIDSIITIDADQRIIRFNASATEMFGCPAEEALGSHVERFMPERFRAGHAEKVRGFAENEAPAKALDLPRRFTGLRANGEEFPFEATLTKVKVDGLTRMTTFIRDISDQVDAEAALRRSKQDLELAVQGANIGIWHFDLRTGVLDWSENNYQLFGLSSGEPMTFEGFLNQLHPEDREGVQIAAQRAMETGERCNIEFRCIWPDGSIHWIAGIGRHLYDEQSGQPVGVRGINFDITDRKAQEKALQDSKAELETRVQERTADLKRANEALERSNLELQQFAFIAAHDLQTPLRSINGFAQLLYKDYRHCFDAQGDIWLNQLVHHTQRMHDLIRDLLGYSRVESRGKTFQPVDSNQVFDDVVDVLEIPIMETGAKITRDDLPMVLADRTQLAQVLQNLIDNALKYRGEDAPRIHVSAFHQGNEWIFSVRDNGIGIAEKHLSNIFDVFRRLHTQQEYPGTGIGLAICRRVIHRHGGHIWVHSEPGKGSTFYFSLPARQ